MKKWTVGGGKWWVALFQGLANIRTSRWNLANSVSYLWMRTTADDEPYSQYMPSYGRLLYHSTISKKMQTVDQYQQSSYHAIAW